MRNNWRTIVLGTLAVLVLLSGLLTTGSAAAQDNTVTVVPAAAAKDLWGFITVPYWVFVLLPFLIVAFILYVLPGMLGGPRTLINVLAGWIFWILLAVILLFWAVPKLFGAIPDEPSAPPPAVVLDGNAQLADCTVEYQGTTYSALEAADLLGVTVTPGMTCDQLVEALKAKVIGTTNAGVTDIDAQPTEDAEAAEDIDAQPTAAAGSMGRVQENDLGLTNNAAFNWDAIPATVPADTLILAHGDLGQPGCKIGYYDPGETMGLPSNTVYRVVIFSGGSEEQRYAMADMRVDSLLASDSSCVKLP